MTYPLLPNAVDLTFEFPATNGPLDAVDLVFGETAGPPPGTVYAATMSVKFSLRGSVTLNYDIGVWRGLSASTGMPHQQAVAQPRTVSSLWSPPVGTALPKTMPFGEGTDAALGLPVGWATPQRTEKRGETPWGTVAQAAGNSAGDRWQSADKAHRETVAPWVEAKHAGRSSGARYGHGKPTHRHEVSPWQSGKAHQRAVTSRMNQAAKAMRPFAVAPWQQGLVLSSYGGPMYLTPPPSVNPGALPVLIDMRFCTRYADDRTTLIFGRNSCGAVTPDAPIYILPARYYMAVHSLEAHLLPSLTPIPIFDVAMAADVDSTVWTFSAKGPMSLFDALAPATAGTPTQIRITLDGLHFVFLVDKLRSEERFGQRQAVVSGRSATALVGQPYARQTSRLSTVAKTAQQHALDALQFSGVGLDWGITDWLVPAGAWSHTGTPLAAVQAIAQAAGGYINSHRSEPTVLVRHPYPTLPGGIPGGPWNWEGAAGAFAADVELAPDALITTSIERVDGPDVDGIYVSGATQGIQAHVYRQGTLGAKLAPMEVDALITANAAAQQKGYSVLGQAGAKHLVQIGMPVLTGGANPGVLDVGQLVQINHTQPWRGRVRSVSVQTDMPKVRQAFALERHLS
jgi:hypothetical protein